MVEHVCNDDHVMEKLKRGLNERSKSLVNFSETRGGINTLSSFLKGV
jgi:hypothetical protein